MARHFTRDEVEELRKMLAILAVKDSELPELESLTDDSLISVSVAGVSYSATIGQLRSEISVIVDAEPTEGSTNAVSSGGVFDAEERLSDRIGDLDTVVSGKYTKPAGGIPEDDLAAAVQTSLGKADTALQEHQSLADYATTAAMNAALATKQDTIQDIDEIRLRAYNAADEQMVEEALAAKQDKLVSGTNIKTINGGELLGAGNIKLPTEDDLVFEKGTGANSVQQKGTGASASGKNSVAQGSTTTSSGESSHAEGENSKATGNRSHAEGIITTASGNASHAEGWSTLAPGVTSHAEGRSSVSGVGTRPDRVTAGLNDGNYSHAEGAASQSSGLASHSEGFHTIAGGRASHSEGEETQASGNYSHTEGYYTQTNNEAEHAEGKYNISIPNKTQHTVGIGTSSVPKNAHVITTDGKHYIPGVGTYQGTETTLPSKQDLATIINKKEDSSNKVIYLSSSSTHVQYPSAKCVYDKFENLISQSDFNAIFN